jgi:hydrogenase maturation protease
MKTLVIGIGHAFRGDDAIGPLVAERIRALGHEAIVHHGEGTDLMERWAGYDCVVIVDATKSKALAGTIRRWDPIAKPLPAQLFPKGSHVFGLVEAIELARTLGRLPAKMTVIGVEGADFTMGWPLSAAIDVGKVVEEVLAS